MRARVNRASSTFLRVALALVAAWSAACTKALPSERPAPSAGGLEPARPAAAPAAVLEPVEAATVGSGGVKSDDIGSADGGSGGVGSGDVGSGGGESGGIESAEVDWQESPLRADLDGDGAPEEIRWSCDLRTLRINVGRAKARASYSVSELIGCTAAVITLRPGEATRQLVVTIDEHDEVGPDLHFIYVYRRSRLERLWSAAASVDFLVDGSWVTQTSDCHEAAGVLVTDTRRHRWSGARVTSAASQVRTPVAPGDCAEP